MTPPAQAPAVPHASPYGLVSLVAAAAGDPSARVTLAGLAAGLAALGFIFESNLQHFLTSWSSDENYSHGFLVPFIALYFANAAAERGPVRVRGGLGLGVALLALGLLVKLATVVLVAGTLGDLALLVALAGLCSLLFGASALCRFGFAIAFLVFMVPLPVALYAMIASPLQLLVSRIASLLLNATNVPVLTEGNMMTLPGGVQMFVAEACSGMRQLTGFLALTAAVAYLVARPAWYRVGVIAAAVPIAMTANVARVTLTGYLMYFVNPEYASGAYHTVEGLLMLGFGLALLRLGCWFFDELFDLGREPTAAPLETPAVVADLEPPPAYETAVLVGPAAGIEPRRARETGHSVPGY